MDAATAKLKGALAKAEAGDYSKATSEAIQALKALEAAGVKDMKVLNVTYNKPTDYIPVIQRAASESAKGTGYGLKLPDVIEQYFAEVSREAAVPKKTKKGGRKSRKDRKTRKGTRKGRRGTRRMA